MARRKAGPLGLTGPSADRMKALEAVAADFKSWRPAREALERVRSVRTIFPQINAGTRVGGWPIQRITVVHGESNHGKTAFVHGLGLSFLLAGHYYAYIDAEMTTPADWVEKLMGRMAESPAFRAMRPRSYEETVDAVRAFVETIATARLKGRLPADTSALIAVDSLRKLVPRRLMDKILKEGAGSKKGSVDGMSGMAARYKAALNSAWLDELVPLMAHTNTAMVIVGREAENDDPFSEDWKLTGGKGLQYDSSLTCRVERGAWVKRGDEVVGERLRVRIRKTKIAGKDNKIVDCYVHLSNGVMIPEGFDRARDVFELALKCGAIEQKGSWFSSCDTGESWQGENAAVLALTEDREGLARMEAEVERRMAR
jgi:recombination protein RecA